MSPWCNRLLCCWHLPFRLVCGGCMRYGSDAAVRCAAAMASEPGGCSERPSTRRAAHPSPRRPGAARNRAAGHHAWDVLWSVFQKLLLLQLYTCVRACFNSPPRSQFKPFQQPIDILSIYLHSSVTMHQSLLSRGRAGVRHTASAKPKVRMGDSAVLVHAYIILQAITHSAAPPLPQCLPAHAAARPAAPLRSQAAAAPCAPSLSRGRRAARRVTVAVAAKLEYQVRGTHAEAAESSGGGLKAGALHLACSQALHTEYWRRPIDWPHTWRAHYEAMVGGGCGAAFAGSGAACMQLQSAANTHTPGTHARLCARARLAGCEGGAQRRQRAAHCDRARGPGSEAVHRDCRHHAAVGGGGRGWGMLQAVFCCAYTHAARMRRARMQWTRSGYLTPWATHPIASPDSLPPPPHNRDVVGPLKGYRLDKIPLGEIVSRVGGQQQFKAACLEHVLLKAQEDVSAALGGGGVGGEWGPAGCWVAGSSAEWARAGGR